jgi:hypothetical protein
MTKRPIPGRARHLEFCGTERDDPNESWIRRLHRKPAVTCVACKGRTHDRAENTPPYLPKTIKPCKNTLPHQVN